MLNLFILFDLILANKSFIKNDEYLIDFRSESNNTEIDNFFSNMG